VKPADRASTYCRRLALRGLGRGAPQIGVPGNRIHAIANGTRDITADTDLRLCKFFRLSEGYFQRLQIAYDTAEAKRRVGADLAKIRPYKPGKVA
jgi:addiction module HigA family antidote